MTRIIGFLKSNAIALIALFIALGGTSYAAVAIPTNSVGTRQLRNGAVTPAKLASGLGGEVWAVTELNPVGTVLMSTPKNVKVEDWRTNTSGVVNEGGIVYYPTRIPKACLPIATSNSFVNTLGEDHLPGIATLRVGRSGVQVASDSASFITVAIVCPR
jgi:hypothetical protein